MDRDFEKEIIEDDVTRLLRQAFGIDEDQLLHDFLLAQTEIKDDQIPPEPVDGFERLIKKMEARGIRPNYINPSRYAALDAAASEEAAASQGEEPTRNDNIVRIRKRRRLKTIVKVAVVAAVLMAMVLGMGMTARARKRYTYVVTEKNDGIDILYEKGNTAGQEDILEDAYKKIYTELGIKVLRLTYIPDNMVFEKINISKNRATLFFDYNGKKVYVIQQVRLEGSSFNTTSDRKPYKTVYNDLFQQRLPIEMNMTENGEKEFHVQIMEQDSYYSVEGIMDENEFEQIVAGIYIFNK